MTEVTDEMVEAAVYACNLHSTWQKTEHDFMRIAIEAALVEYEQSDERLSARKASTCEIERREMNNEEVAKRNAELVDAIKIERASLKRKRDAAEQMLEALNYVADATYCGADTDWHFKREYDPQIVLDAINAARGE